MEIYDKHTKEIHSLLQEIRNPNANKVQLNELLFVNLSSLCKFVSGKDNFKECSTLENIIYGKQDENIITKKDERINENSERLERMDKFNDLSIIEKSREISKGENIKRDKLNDMSMTFNTQKTAENFDNRKGKQTLELDEESKLITSKFNEINIDCFSEK
jgi:hypothetical protein